MKPLLVIILGTGLALSPGWTHAKSLRTPAPGITAIDNVDAEDEDCDGLDDDDSPRVTFRVINNQSQTPIAEVRILLDEEEDDCEVSSASAPAGWTVQLESDHVVYSALTPNDYILPGNELRGFSFEHENEDDDCCLPLRFFGPGGSPIDDDDDDEDDCFCTLLPVAPASWSGMKVLFR